MLMIISAPDVRTSFKDEIRLVNAGFTSMPLVSAMAKFVRLDFIESIE